MHQAGEGVIEGAAIAAEATAAEATAAEATAATNIILRHMYHSNGT